jgi:hypothetical protein
MSSRINASTNYIPLTEGLIYLIGVACVTRRDKNMEV